MNNKTKSIPIVGGVNMFNPFEKYAQIKMGESSPSFGVKIPKYVKSPPSTLEI